MLSLASLLYLQLTTDRSIGTWTKPTDDWLIGYEYIPEVRLDEIKWQGSMISVGIFFYRIDFLKSKKEE